MLASISGHFGQKPASVVALAGFVYCGIECSQFQMETALSLSNTFETSVLTWLLTGDAVTRPSSFYLGLFTSDPTDAGTGTEVSGGAYVREAATFSVTGDTATTTAAVEWPVATANWGTITHVAVHDALTGGNIIAYAALTASKTINTDDVFRIPAGDLDITID